MKKTKLKKGDVVVFEWNSEFFIGYVYYESFSGNISVITDECIEMFGGQEFPYHKEYHVKPNDLTYIGKL